MLGSATSHSAVGARRSFSPYRDRAYPRPVPPPPIPSQAACQTLPQAHQRLPEPALGKQGAQTLWLKGAPPPAGTLLGDQRPGPGLEVCVGERHQTDYQTGDEGGSSLKLGWGGALAPPSPSPYRCVTPPPTSSPGPLLPSEIHPSTTHPPQDIINLTLPLPFSEPQTPHHGTAVPASFRGIFPAWDTGSRGKGRRTQEGFLSGSPTSHPPSDCEPQKGGAWAVSVSAGPPARREQVLWECVGEGDRKESREEGREEREEGDLKLKAPPFFPQLSPSTHQRAPCSNKSLIRRLSLPYRQNQLEEEDYGQFRLPKAT